MAPEKMLLTAAKQIHSSRMSGVMRYRELANVLRRHIGEAGLKAGDQLPTFRDMARVLQVSQSTANRAVKELEDEGTVERRCGRGIFVADRMATGEFAMVISPELLQADASPYFQLVIRAVTDALHEKNDQWRVKMHVGRSGRDQRDFPATLDLGEPVVLSRLRGVFSFHLLYELEEVLAAAKVPTVMLHAHLRSIPEVPYSVQFERETMLPLAVRHLHEVGCQRVGLLWQVYPERMHSAEPTDGDRFLRLVAEEGMETRADWMPYHDWHVAEQEGYRLFNRLWEQPDRPDAVVVTDDVLCRGVLRATLERGVRLPEDLRLITNANAYVPLPFHKSVTRVEFDGMEQGQTGAEMMLELVRGRRPKNPNVILPGRLIQGKTT